MLDDETMRKLSIILVLARADPAAVTKKLKEISNIEISEQELLAIVDRFIREQKMYDI